MSRYDNSIASVRSREKASGPSTLIKDLVTYPMGGNWYIINYYVPVIGIIHIWIRR